MVTPVIVRPDELPRILFVEQLSAVIRKTPTTIRTCATNPKYQHLIHKPFKMPHSRRLCWYEQDVLAWIDSHRPAPEPVRRPRGRPTKVAELARQRHENLQKTESINSHQPAPQSVRRTGGTSKKIAEPARPHHRESVKKGG
jgi:hypothetical protein